MKSLFYGNVLLLIPMGGKVPLLFFIFCSIPMGVVRAGIPPFPLSQATARPKRPENLTPDEKVRILSERGSPVAAVLQYIENISALHLNGSCRRSSLDEFTSKEFDWRQLSKLGNFEKQMNAAVKTANILNHYFLRAPNDTEINALFFYSLVKANIESDPSLSSSSIVLTSELGELFVPFTYRRSDGTLKTSGLGSWLLDRWPGNDWFWMLQEGNYSELFGQVGNGTDLVVTVEDGYWTAPYIDCNLTTTWHITYGIPFFSRSNDELYFKGVVSVTLPMTNVDIDQCDAGNHLSAFSSSHHCDAATTQCVPVHGKGFRRGAYKCLCKPNHYPASTEAQRRGSNYYDGEAVENAYVESVLLGQNKFSSSFQCLPCRVGCDVCIGDQPCYVEYDLMLRSLVLCFQSFCSTIVIILIVVVFVLRKKRIFSSSMWVMLETILVGALFLYQ
ncbi:putative G-protein coupled receptor 158, partial [Stegodyphus mimosarum]